MRLEEWAAEVVIEVISERTHSRTRCRNEQPLQGEIKSWKDVSPSLVDWKITQRVLVLCTHHQWVFFHFPLSSCFSTLHEAMWKISQNCVLCVKTCKNWCNDSLSYWHCCFVKTWGSSRKMTTEVWVCEQQHNLVESLEHQIGTSYSCSAIVTKAHEIFSCNLTWKQIWRWKLC